MFKQMFRNLGLSVSLVALMLPYLNAQALENTPHASTIEGVLSQLTQYYIFPEIAEEMASKIRAKQKAGEYDALAEGKEIADQLTRDLYSLSKDGHIKVRFSEAPLPSATENNSEPNEAEIRNQFAEMFGEINFGSERVEVLPGNIGYYKLSVLTDAYFARSRHGAAMTLLAGTQALILDFRDNRGAIGEGSVEALASYFFEKPTHLSDRYWREFDRVERIVTHNDISGPKYLGRPIYILTSRRTYSGAEAVASQLQEHGRAKIIGERSGGGANPGQPRRATDHYTVWVPGGKVSNAISGTNWEGHGVIPDVQAPAQKSLFVAHKLVLDELVARASKGDSKRKLAIEEHKQVIERKLSEFRSVEFSLDGYSTAKEVLVVGEFNHWSGGNFSLTRSGDRWVGETELTPGTYLYRFEVDGVALPDPRNAQQEKVGSQINSMLSVN